MKMALLHHRYFSTPMHFLPLAILCFNDVYVNSACDGEFRLIFAIPCEPFVSSTYSVVFLFSVDCLSRYTIDFQCDIGSFGELETNSDNVRTFSRIRVGDNFLGKIENIAGEKCRGYCLDI